jgi:hypothetical protein
VSDDDRDRPAQAEPTPVERLLARRSEHEEGARPLSRSALQYRRSLESYLKAGNRPRWMERIAEIDQGISRQRRLLEEAYRRLREDRGSDPAAFAERWRQVAESWPFDELNELIRQHNDWYPIERQLAVDPRTRDYVLIHGRSYRRPELGPRWVLEQFPTA